MYLPTIITQYTVLAFKETSIGLIALFANGDLDLVSPPTR